MKVNRIFRRGRGKPYGVEFYVPTGEGLRRRRKFHETAADAAAYAEQLREQARLEGMAPLRLSAEEAATWERLKVWCKERGQEPVLAVQRFLEAGGAATQTLSVEEAGAAWIEDKRLQKVDAGYIRHLENYVTKFSAAFPGRSMASIQPDEIRGWLTGLGFATETQIGYRKYIGGFFEFALRQGWTTRNPVRLVARPRLIRPEPEFLTVEEAQRLFATAQDMDPEACGLMALGAFTGLRVSTVLRMTADEVDLTAQRIVLPAHKMKGGRRHILEGLPDNLWVWLRSTPPGYGMVAKEYFQRRGAIFQAAKVKARKNLFRHSFATYFCALKGEAASAAAILAQRDPRMVWEHYKGAATKAAAKAYFEVKPNK